METKRLVRVSGQGKTEFWVSSWATEQELMRVIEDQLGIPVDQQRLVHQGKNVLNITEILEREEVVDLGVVMKMRGGRHVIIKFQDGKEMAFDVDLKDTRVIRIKEMIYEKHGFSPEILILKYRGRVLQNEEKVQNFAQRDMQPKLELRFQTDEIALHMSIVETGEPLVIRTDKRATIKELKRTISQRTGQPAQQLKITCFGVALSDEEQVHQRLSSQVALFISKQPTRQPSLQTSRNRTISGPVRRGKCFEFWHKFCSCCFTKKHKKKQALSYEVLPEGE